MAIQLTKATEHELKAKVHSGPYRSVNAVIREGLALIAERDAFRQAVREGEAQLARGQIATSGKLACTAFIADEGNAPSTSMVCLTIIKKLGQKGE